MNREYFKNIGIVQYYINETNTKKIYYHKIFNELYELKQYHFDYLSTLFIGIESIENYNNDLNKIYVYLNNDDINKNIDKYKSKILKIFTDSEIISEYAIQNKIPFESNKNIECPLIINSIKNKNIKDETLFNKYKTLFNKYILEIRVPDNELNYKILLNNENTKNYICHLHILNIDKFSEFYGEYINDIIENFYVIITFCYGDINLNNEIIQNVTILKIPNKGFDIGGKICALDFIYKNLINFDYILFLHSKTDINKRKQYYHPFIKNKNRIYLIKKILSMNKNLNGIFPNLPWYNINNKTNYNKHDVYASNINYYSEILDYLKCPNREKLFVEGNCMILSKKIIDYIFKDNIKIFYNLMNEDNSFDYNWVKIFYNDNSNYNILYNKYLVNNWYGNNINLADTNKSLPDGMIEHVFERIWINIIKHLGGDYLLLDKLNIFDFFKIKINSIYFPQFHEFVENNKFWGNGFTEWTLLKPFKGSINIRVRDEQEKIQTLKPHDDIGYYDLANINTLKKQINIAKKYSINGFVIYHYWFNKNKILMNKPLEYFLRNDINFPFCISWANETWSKRWDGTNKEVMIKQEYNKNDYVDHIKYLMQFFKKKNYMKNYNGECILYIYNICDIPNFKEMENIWTSELNKNKLKIKIIVTENSVKKNHNWGNKKYDKFLFEPMYSTIYCHQLKKIIPIPKDQFDFAFYYKENKDIATSYYYNNDELYDHYVKYGIKELNSKKINEENNMLCFSYSYDEIINNYMEGKYDTTNKHLGLALYWNNMVRRKNIPFMIISDFSHEKMQEMLIILISIIVLRYKNVFNFNACKYENIINVNAWNEWNEQAVLEPNNIYGYKNLQVIYSIINNL